MKRRATGIVLVVIGGVFLLMAPVWRLAIAPLFIRIPVDLEVESKFKGTLKVFLDRQKMVPYPRGAEEVVPLGIHATEEAVPGQTDPDTIVIHETVVVKDGRTGQPLEGVRPNRYYVLDRMTCENVPYGIRVGGKTFKTDRYGYSLKYPMDAEKTTYEFYDDELKRTIPSEFVAASRIDGREYKDVEVYSYRIDTGMEKMAQPPPGVPAELTGKVIKELLGMPGLPISDSTRIPLDYYKKLDAVQVVEPRTGIVVDTPKNEYSYYVNTAPTGAPNYMKIATVSYSTPGGAAASVIDDCAKYFGLMDADVVGIPLMFLVVGISLLAPGVVILSRKAPADAGRRSGSEDSEGEEHKDG